MDKIEKTTEELEDTNSIDFNTINGDLLKEILEKINEIIDWINTQ